MLRVILNPKEEENLLCGFPWVYNNEVNSFIGTIENGTVVRVEASNQTFVGYGFFNIDSKLMVRMLTLEEEKIDKEFLEEEFVMR